MKLFADPEGTLSTRQRTRVFGLTWLSYATYYLARKNFAVVKAQLAQSYGLTSVQLGNIDTGHLATYALGQIAFGVLGDRTGGRRLVGAGMLLSAVCCLAFGFGSTAWVFALWFALNGLAQATGWPGNVKSMAVWFRSRERGTVMGVWTTNYQVGGLVATALATWLLSHAGWRAAFFVPAGCLAAVGLAVWLWLPEMPATVVSTVDAPVTPAPAPGAMTLLRMSGIWTLGTAYFCLKLIRYSILFWLPFYLKT